MQKHCKHHYGAISCANYLLMLLYYHDDNYEKRAKKSEWRCVFKWAIAHSNVFYLLFEKDLATSRVVLTVDNKSTFQKFVVL